MNFSTSVSEFIWAKTLPKWLIAGQIAICFLLFASIYAQPFTEIPVSIPGVVGGAAAWGDFDNDRDLDLVVSGDSTGSTHFFLKIYRNENSIFTSIGPSLLHVAAHSLEWGDCDNDGDLDLLVMGAISDVAGTTKIYLNDNGVFIDAGGSLRPFERGSASWGDYDNDGDLDFVICGASLPNGIFSRVYENVGGITFNENDVGLPGIFLGNIGWVDYDCDDDLDIFLTGEDGYNNKITRLYRNDEGVFVESGITLPNLQDGFFGWADADGDRDPDLALAGSGTGGYYAQLLLNDNGSFINGSALQEAIGGIAAWGDLDNDRWPDLLFTGFIFSSQTSFATIYRNDGNGGLININPNIAQIFTIAAMGDYDNDADIDFVSGGGLQFKLYRNETANIAPLPEVPENLSAVVEQESAFLKWSAGQNDSVNYSYNVRIGTSPGLGNIVSPMADSSGYRLIPGEGNAGYDTTFVIKNLLPGTYYWSVQSLSANYSASAFAVKDSFIIDSNPQNQPPVVVHPIPNQALVLGRDIFLRNLLAAPVIFEDPEGNPLIFSAASGDTLIATVQISGPFLTVTPQNAGTTTISVTATDNLAGSVQTSFTVHSIPLPQNTTFTLGHELPPLAEGATAWGDFDNDNDLDLVITGTDPQYQAVCKIFRNDGNSFEDIQANLTPVYLSDVAWGDYDNDEDLDLVITGWNPPATRTILYRNDNGNFIEVQTPFQNVRESALAWGDYDNDGDLDIVISGNTAGGSTIMRLYQNSKGVFTEVPVSLPGISNGSVTWGDYDTDGDLDLLLCGDSPGGKIAQLLRNENGEFEPVNAGIAAVSYSDAAFGDYDNDGDLDILISGQAETEPVSKIYQNVEGEFVDILANIKYTRGGSVEWGDYENDGDLDIIVTGYNEIDTTFTAILYENYSGSFVDTEIPIPGADGSACEWGDYDNDGDLDFIISGVQYIGIGFFTRIYENQLSVSNTLPTSPPNLQAYREGSDLILSWDKATDNETEQDALTYNLRVGTTPTGSEIVAPMSDIITGYRSEPSSGNVYHNTSWRIKNVQDSVIYWTVQAIDNAFAGSEFSELQQYIVGTHLSDNPLNLQFTLEQNYPNPFNPETTIEFEIPRATVVTISIYNITGEKILTLLNEFRPAGRHSMVWKGEDRYSSKVPSGVYFYRIKAGEFKAVRKMILIR